MPNALQKLLALALIEMGKLTTALQEGRSTVEAWRAGVGRLLARGWIAGLFTGQGNTTLTPQGRAVVAEGVKDQLTYLDKFVLEIQDTAQWQNGWNARAAMYAKSIAVPYWRGRTKMLPLPAMPRDGSTQCLTNCTCVWRITTLDEEQGDYDAYWRMGAVEHCQTCIQRAQEWAPLRIRGGELI